MAQQKNGEFKLKQQTRAAEFVKVGTETDAQVYLAELELDEGVYEVVLHVLDVTLQNFIAKRISINIRAGETPPPPPAA